ncbi:MULTISPECIES: hypothetical protein [unclassified Streptomyces]|uniref:hypothetical protein n=1 Tax=unclassified Streptomyces TaxID=2593676 RepID=UPI00365F3823
MPDEEELPVYSASEIAATLLDFFTFLTTLHCHPDDIVMPPPGGWPDYTPENCAGFKSDFAIEVLRNLPYLDSRASDHSDSLGQIHYKSHLLDYTTFDLERFTDQEHLWSGSEESEDEETVPDHVFIIAEGFESGGRTLFLDVLEGEIFEAEIRCDDFREDLKEYFEDLKEKYRSLELIPCPGEEMIEVRAAGVGPEIPGEVFSEEEVLMQTDELWGTHLDIRYTRQLYRAFGWPNAFRRDEALREMKELIAKRKS